MMDALGAQIKALENYIIRHARGYDPKSFYRLQAAPSIGNILALVTLYSSENEKEPIIIFHKRTAASFREKIVFPFSNLL